MVRRALFILAVFPLITILLLHMALHQYPLYYAQPSATTYIVEAVVPLLAYSLLLFIAASRIRPTLAAYLRFAIVLGLALGVMEFCAVCIESGVPFGVQGPWLQITFILTLFSGWGVAAFRARRHAATLPQALASAICTGMVSMAFAITFASLFELFLHPPNPAYVTLWGEYQRAHWTDPRAFALANTMDSITSHLLAAPVVASIFGLLGYFAAELLPPSQRSTGATLPTPR